MNANKKYNPSVINGGGRTHACWQWNLNYERDFDKNEVCDDESFHLDTAGGEPQPRPTSEPKRLHDTHHAA
jgi:hypothetical protein